MSEPGQDRDTADGGANTHGETVDWDRFWADADADRRDSAVASTVHARETLLAFLDETGTPGAVADVGCGPGEVTFAVADRYPEATVVGYDRARSALRENRERAARDGVENVRFERTVLPEFDPGRSFDVVFCYATLSYVPEVERAVEALYDAVAPGGHLVCSYSNSLGRSHYQSVAADPAEHLPADSGFDPDRYADRFQHVIEGESLLSYRRMHDALGTWPQSVWSVVEKPDIRYAWRHHPLVYVPK